MSTAIRPLLGMLIGTGPLATGAAEAGSLEEAANPIHNGVSQQEDLSGAVSVTDAEGAGGDGVGASVGHEGH